MYNHHCSNRSRGEARQNVEQNKKVYYRQVLRKWYIPSHITLPKTFASYQNFAKYNEPIQLQSSSSRCGSPLFIKSGCDYKWFRTSPLGIRRVHLYKARSPQEFIFVYVASADPYTSETMPTHVLYFQKSTSSSTASCPSAAP